MDNQSMMNVIDAVTNTKVLVDKGWCQESWAKNKDGERVHYEDNTAVEFDMAGALFKSCKDLDCTERDTVMFFMDATIQYEQERKKEEPSTMIKFNDSCETKEQVLLLLNKLIENLNSTLNSTQ